MRLLKNLPTLGEISSWCGGPTIWGPALLGVVLLWGTSAPAEVTPLQAEQHCREMITENGGEIATSIEISGPPWQSSWGETVMGDTITATFAEGALTLSDQTSIMADHVLTIEKRQAEASGILVARYEINGASIALLVIPTTASLAGDQSDCFYEWLIRQYR